MSVTTNQHVHQSKSEMPEEYDLSQARRGPIIPAVPGKTRITIRLDNDILAWFRAQVHQQGGGNYQTLINRALRAYIEHEQDSLEGMLRRVLREELQRASETGEGLGP